MTAPHIVLVSYVLRPAARLEAVSARLKHKANLVDHAKIVADLAEKRAALASDLYGGTFEAVRLAAPSAKKSPTWRHKGVDGQISQAVGAFLTKTFPSAWEPKFVFADRPQVVFFGFGTARFVKMLGLECAAQGAPLPPGIWYGTSAHKDLEGALLPDTFCKGLELADALGEMGFPQEEGWAPHRDVESDLALVAEVCAKLSFV